MEKYWFIHIKDDDGAVAESPDERTLNDWAEIIISSKEFPFTYKVNDDELFLQDYLADDLGIPLMSEKLKNVIEKYLTGKEGLHWLEVFVMCHNEKSRYFAPKFKTNLDILNNEKSLFNNNTGSLIKANILLSKVVDFAFFPLPELSHDSPFTFRMIVSDDIKKEISNLKLTGIDFFKVPAS